MGDLANKLAGVPQADAKLLFLDIERLPGLARIWDQRTRFVHIDNFERLPSLLCFSAAWGHEDKTQFYSVWDDPEEMVEASWKLYNDADIVIGYNHVGFDNKHLRGEWLTKGYVPPMPWKDVDLYRHSAQFGFESRSLRHLCQRLGIPNKSGYYDAEMAQRAIDGDAKAQRDMKRYSVTDTKILKPAYLRLLPWIKGHPHVGVTHNDEVMLCPRCAKQVGADERAGTWDANQIRYTAYRCDGCGGPLSGTRHSRIANTRAR